MADVMRFALEIRLGNAAMSDGRDIAAALEEVAELIRDEGPFEEPMLMDTVIGRTVPDINGTTIGQWAVQSLSEEQAARRTAFAAPKGRHESDSEPAFTFGGYTDQQLRDAFELVKPRSDWKYPVDAIVDAKADRSAIDFAMLFFTGGPATFADLPGGRVRVTGDGYYRCIGS